VCQSHRTVDKALIAAENVDEGELTTESSSVVGSDELGVTGVDEVAADSEQEGGVSIIQTFTDASEVADGVSTQMPGAEDEEGSGDSSETVTIGDKGNF